MHVCANTRLQPAPASSLVAVTRGHGCCLASVTQATGCKLAITLALFDRIYEHWLCSASHEIHFCGCALAIRLQRLEFLQGPPRCSNGAIADAPGQTRKEKFPLQLRNGIHSNGDVPAPQITMQATSSGPRPSLACGAEASPEHHAANLDGVKKRGLLQRAKSVASRRDRLQPELCNQAHVAANVDPKRVDDYIRTHVHKQEKHDH